MPHRQQEVIHMRVNVYALLLFFGGLAIVGGAVSRDLNSIHAQPSNVQAQFAASAGGCNGVPSALEPRSYPAKEEGPDLDDSQFKTAVTWAELTSEYYDQKDEKLKDWGDAVGFVKATPSACNKLMDAVKLPENTGYFAGIAFVEPKTSTTNAQLKSWVWVDNFHGSYRIVLIDMESKTVKKMTATLISPVTAWPSGYEEIPGAWVRYNNQYDRIQVMIGPNSYIATTQKIP